MSLLDVFLVESPLQCLNATEAAFKLSKKRIKFLFVRLNEVESNNEQIKSVASLFDWDYVHFSKIENGTSWLKFLKFILFSRQIYQLIRPMDVQTIYFGDFRSYWMDSVRQLFCDIDHYLLDDGDITLSIVENFLKREQGSFFSGLVKYPNALVNSRFNFKLSTPKIFTSFDISGYPGIVKNEFEFLKSKSTVMKETASGLVYFFGSRYSEEGILSLEYEIKMLERCIKYLERSYSKVVYVPHRGDSIEKLKILSEFVEIKHFLMPAEIFLATSNVIVDAIAGCCTSALNNLNTIFRYKNIISFMLPLNEIGQIYRDDFQLTYDSYKRLGFKIIDIKDL